MEIMYTDKTAARKKGAVGRVERHVEQDSTGELVWYSVESGTGTRTYEVLVDVTESFATSCACSDYLYRCAALKASCKHMDAVQTHIHREKGR